MNILIFNYLHNLSHQSQGFDNLVIFIAEPFGYIVLAFAVLFLFFHHDVFKTKNVFEAFVLRWKEIFFVLFSSFFAWAIAKVLKAIIHKPRPFLMFSEVEPLFLHGGMDSFPSGHATLFGALAVAIFLVHKKIGYLFIFFALIIGLSRIISGIHFPVDILGGFLLGALISFLMRNRFVSKK